MMQFASTPYIIDDIILSLGNMSMYGGCEGETMLFHAVGTTSSALPCV